MAKAIKFNLMLDSKPVRDIEGLRENFCIDDVLDFYQKRLLQKWLKVRGYEDLLEKVEAIKANQSAVIELIKIFDIQKSEKEIKEAVYSLEFWQERKIELEEWHKKDLRIKEIVADYHNGYDVLKAKILENKEDMPFMKSATKEIYDKYLEIFRIDFRYFFNDFKEKSPLIVYAVLMNQDLRKFFLEDNSIKQELSNSFLLQDLKVAKTKFYSIFDDFSKKENKDYDELSAIDKIQKNTKLHTFTGITDGYWKDLEEVKTKVMVLSIPSGTFVRSVNKPKEEISAQEINGNFLSLDGLLYKSNNSSSPVVYLEV